MCSLVGQNCCESVQGKIFVIKTFLRSMLNSTDNKETAKKIELFLIQFNTLQQINKFIYFFSLSFILKILTSMITKTSGDCEPAFQILGLNPEENKFVKKSQPIILHKWIYYQLKNENSIRI